MLRPNSRLVLPALLAGTLAPSCGRTEPHDRSIPAAARDSAPASRAAAGAVVASATTGGVRLTNRGDQAIWYALFESDLASRSLFTPTVDPRGPTVAAGADTLVPWTTATGYRAGARRYVVYWWTRVSPPEGPPRAGPIQTVDVLR